MLLWGSHLEILRGYTWLWTQESLLVAFRGLYRVMGIVPGLATCKESAWPTLPSLRPRRLSFRLPLCVTITGRENLSIRIVHLKARAVAFWGRAVWLRLKYSIAFTKKQNRPTASVERDWRNWKENKRCRASTTWVLVYKTSRLLRSSTHQTLQHQQDTHSKPLPPHFPDIPPILWIDATQKRFDENW